MSEKFNLPTSSRLLHPVIFILGAVIFIIGIAGNSFAATICVGPSATGNGSGADWNNLKAWTSIPSRGDTWFLVDGTYSGKTFSVSASGTTPITIRKATPENHGGILTGWSDTLGDGQAVFSGTITFNSSYWIFDGAKHGSTLWSTNASDYGFYSSGLTFAIRVYNTSSDISNVTIANYAGIARSGDVEKMFVATDNSTRAVSFITISHCLVNGWQNAYWATSAGRTMNTWIFEYSVCINGSGSTANHGEWINNNYGLMENQITRFNRFVGPSSGFTGVIVANNEDNRNPQIYGNVFDSYKSGNGVITGTSAGKIIGAKIYNNTFLNCTVAWLGNTASSGGSVAYNNLLYNMNGSNTSGFTVDHNSYYSCTSVSSESNPHTGTGNPFNNSASGDYALKVNTPGGTPLSSPYDIDARGKIRSSWTRGAFEFGSTGSGAAPSAPTDLTITQ